MIQIDIFEQISRSIPKLGSKLIQSGIKDTPQRFIKKIAIVSLYYSFGINILLLFAFLKYKTLALVLLILFPISFLVLFGFFLKLPEVRIKSRQREIDKELIYVGKFLLIELSAGVSLFDAMTSVAQNFEAAGKFFRRLADKIKMGTPIEAALNEAIEEAPSENLKKILWQINNSLQTGSDIASSLNIVLDQISQEQLIQIQQYGKKLNPLAMFYMMLAVIVPSLGITMLVVLSTLIKFKINLPILLGIAVCIGFVQFMFINIIKSSRPAVDL
ncbi:type II secretion system F family protein [Candidatus Woesearchaeota archaeon]|nr:type II secretion system F family protein [Candidatus Woesearchaeota archaeon]